MKLIVDIPETEYQMFTVVCNNGIGNTAMERILEGNPLEYVLDKIRAEIEAIDIVKCKVVDSNIIKSPQRIKDEMLEIIDKYRAESEDEE